MGRCEKCTVAATTVSAKIYPSSAGLRRREQNARRKKHRTKYRRENVGHDKARAPRQAGQYAE